MSVLIETSLGDIVMDLFSKECPLATRNFLKLCKLKFYNNCLFYDVQKDYLTKIRHSDETHKATSLYGFFHIFR